MSENKGKSTGGTQRSGADRSGAQRSTHRDGAGRPTADTTKKKTTGTGSASGKSGPARPAASKPGAAKPAAGKSGTAKSGSPKSGAAKSGTAKSGANKSSAARTGASKAAGGAARGTAAKTGANRPAAKKNADTRPANPRRDSQDERDLHNSPNAKRLADERRRRKYNKNRRLYNFMFYAAIAVAVISVVVILSVTVLFNISAITVERGRNVPYTDEEILMACGIEPGDNLFAIDTEQAALNVTTNLPYIEVCNLTRKLPSTLELDVHAAVVLGSVTTNDGAYIVLSANGRALEYADAYDGSVPLTRLNGMEMTFGGIGCPADIADTGELEVAAELVVGFSLYDLRLDEITFENNGSVSVLYDGRVRIKFGVPTDLSQKIQVGASMISEGKIARNEAGILDLSISERAIFTPDYLVSGE